jgi:hypothetical protein
MPSLQKAVVPSFTTPLLGNIPNEINMPSQGSIILYENNDCTLPLTQLATPLLLEGCYNVPVTGIRAVSIDSTPTCSNDGSPILIVSNLADCKSSTAGVSANGGVVGGCQTFSSGIDIGSVQFTCFGNSVITMTKDEVATSRKGRSSNKKARDTDVNVDVSVACPCCTVM